MTQILPLLVVIALIGIVSLWYRRATGIVRPIDATFSPADLRELGLAAGAQSLLLFTAPGCPPCTVAKRVLDDVGTRLGVAVVTADVTEHATIAADQHVYRAPTVFVVDRGGHAIARIAGIPRDGELDAVLNPMEDLVA